MCFKFLALVVTVFLGGCSPKLGSSWTDSGLADAFENEVIVNAAGSAHGIRVEGGAASSSHTPDYREIERRFEFTAPSDSTAAFLEALMKNVKQEIARSGGADEGGGEGSMLSEDVEFRRSSYEYSWRGNIGFLKLYAYRNSDDRVLLVVHCYEHRR